MIGDGLTGAALFAIVAGTTCGDPRTWQFSSASAAETTVVRALDASSPPGPAAENAMVAALVRPTLPRDDLASGSALAVLGLTFSLMFAFNVSILRHLRRAYASPRRGSWGRGG